MKFYLEVEQQKSGNFKYTVKSDNGEIQTWGYRETENIARRDGNEDLLICRHFYRNFVAAGSGGTDRSDNIAAKDDHNVER